MLCAARHFWYRRRFMKTVIFALNSSYSHTSLAVRAIARGMERHGLCCEIIEKNQKDKRGAILATLAEASADIYGFSAYIWNREELKLYLLVGSDVCHSVR